MELYNRPQNLFVAQFIGSPAMNIIPATIEKTGPSAVVTLTGGVSVDTGIAVDDSEKGQDGFLRRATRGPRYLLRRRFPVRGNRVHPSRRWAR